MTRFSQNYLNQIKKIIIKKTIEQNYIYNNYVYLSSFYEYKKIRAL